VLGAHVVAMKDVRSRKRARRRRASGQTLVEFALTFPIFVSMMIGIIEFSLVYNALLSIGHASRDAALAAAEAGNSAFADCLILRVVEQDVSAPAADNRIQEVDIYRADQNGAVYGGQQNTYTRTGSTSCTMPDGSTLTVPYTATSSTYPASSRCDIIAGTAGGCQSGHPTVDTIGVKITYLHSWVTPLPNLVSLSGSGATLVQSTAMRMEPVL